MCLGYVRRSGILACEKKVGVGETGTSTELAQLRVRSGLTGRSSPTHEPNAAATVELTFGCDGVRLSDAQETIAAETSAPNDGAICKFLCDDGGVELGACESCNGAVGMVGCEPKDQEGLLAIVATFRDPEANEGVSCGEEVPLLAFAKAVATPSRKADAKAVAT